VAGTTLVPEDGVFPQEAEAACVVDLYGADEGAEEEVYDHYGVTVCCRHILQNAREAGGCTTL
jgi:hypothetical protein